MANFTAREQLMLELINRARMDPAGEARRYGIALNEGVSAANAISTTPKQVLAGNDQLGVSADRHSKWMIDQGIFAHNEVPGPYYTPFNRMNKAGYLYTTAGENIAWLGTTGTLNLTQSILDLHRNLFVDEGVAGRGHRLNILNANFKEIGIGHAAGVYKGYNASMVTQDLAAKSTTTFITGVVYNDTVTNDNFFTVGEETANLRVSGSGATDTTGAGGGYELAYTVGGSKTITFDIAGTTADLIVKLTLGGTNVKIDAVNGREIWSNVSLTSQSAAIKEIHALGVSAVNFSGSSTTEKIYGNAGANALDGNGGNDVISGGSGVDTIIGGLGSDTMTGGAGNDVFVFETASDSPVAAPDTIVDFGDSGVDRLDLSRLFSGVLTYRDEAAITGANQVNVTGSGTTVIVHINLDADRTDEMQIKLANTTLSSMTAADFIL